MVCSPFGIATGSIIDFIIQDDPRMPPIQTLLSLTRRFLELSLFTQALVLIQSILASDDEEIDAWYLQGWCFFLMAQQSKETGQPIDGLGWAELARDSRDCLEACQVVIIPILVPWKPHCL